MRTDLIPPIAGIHTLFRIIAPAAKVHGTGSPRAALARNAPNVVPVSGVSSTTTRDWVTLTATIDTCTS
ncbi:hypothetical protein BMS3Bbin02_02062 [bacterium BMS3Bbin02]|nr:hypothetical protein BMS3Bbin02_02062 [bacterium BMS3Bbin02]